ncbi:hypothetical protein [Sabulicella glaciei]|uniref:Uncharacterized protein n=1 Tax=Sabulicella glaciei TaxID=2984948 RepID=A0ABT3NVA4_9PROT|nr:hypothetical protein [Roseococcus sp. MDT2-1-1]MCW8086096.1 hypothetical protein [Roseococcus sp. MDT2-1-1]
MLTRTQTTTMVFRHSFVLKGLDRPLPAGTYDVETEEQLLEDLSFPVYRRISTMLIPRTHAPHEHPNANIVDPSELERAHAADRERLP